jgi:outer membrane protein
MFSMRLLRAGALALALALLPGVARAETLREALEFAYANNPTIMSALLSVKMSAEDIALRKAGKLPTIAATGMVSGAFSTVGSQFTTSRSHRLSLSYNQTLFDNFQTESQIEQARAFTELSKYALRNAEQNVLLAVATAYMNVVRDSQLVALRQENVSFFEAQVDSSETRLRLGEGTEIEVSQARTRHAAAVAAYRAAVASLTTSQAAYERWVGRKPRNLSSGYNFNGMLPPSLEAALASSETKNPAILTARAAIRAAQAGSDAARAAFGPTINLIGSLCGIGCGQADPDAGGVSGSISLQFSIPIYAGGSLGASVRKANLAQIQSEVDALSARDQVRESVIAAWASLQNAAAQIQSAQSAVASGQLVVEGTIRERDVGQKTTLDVLNAQAELTSAREALISASASRVIASFALLAAAGRLSAPDLNLKVAVHSADGYIATVEDVWQELRAIDE